MSSRTTLLPTIGISMDISQRNWRRLSSAASATHSCLISTTTSFLFTVSARCCGATLGRDIILSLPLPEVLESEHLNLEHVCHPLGELGCAGPTRFRERSPTRCAETAVIRVTRFPCNCRFVMNHFPHNELVARRIGNVEPEISDALVDGRSDGDFSWEGFNTASPA